MITGPATTKETMTAGMITAAGQLMSSEMTGIEMIATVTITTEELMTSKDQMKMIKEEIGTEGITEDATDR